MYTHYTWEYGRFKISIWKPIFGIIEIAKHWSPFLLATDEQSGQII